MDTLRLHNRDEKSSKFFSTAYKKQMGIVRIEGNLQQKFCAIMQMVHSFHHFSYLRGKTCGNGFLMGLLHGAKFLVQAIDTSKEEYLFDSCSSILKNFARKFCSFWKTMNPRSTLRLQIMPQKTRFGFHHFYLVQRTKCSFCILLCRPRPVKIMY